MTPSPPDRIFCPVALHIGICAQTVGNIDTAIAGLPCKVFLSWSAERNDIRRISGAKTLSRQEIGCGESIDGRIDIGRRVRRRLELQIRGSHTIL